MSIRMGLVALLAVGALSACGDDGVTFSPAPTPTPETTASVTPTRNGAASEPIEELRVAFVNLAMPPAPASGEGGTAPAETPVEAATFDARLTGLATELESLRPDIVVLNEASWTRNVGRATKLAEALGMEFSYARANPWPDGRSREDSDELADTQGHEEGELVLVRSPLRLLEAETASLVPRNEAGERRVALWVSVALPGTNQAFSVYSVNFAWDDPEVNAELARGFAAFVEETRGEAPVIVAAGMATPTSEVLGVFAEAGLTDLAAELFGEDAPATCCRPELTVPADGEPGEDGDDPDAGTVTPNADPVMSERRDYLFTDRWEPATMELFGMEPVTLADGSMVYPSDHAGIAVVLPLDSDRFRAMPRLLE